MIQLNGTHLRISYFPNQEVKLDEEQIKKEMGQFNTLTFTYDNNSDLINLMFVKFYMDSVGKHNTQLSISYMPYSRMDRSVDGSAFTLKYVADFINALHFDKVWVTEPHSEITTALLDNSVAVFTSVDILERAKKEIEFDEDLDVILFPDAGAEKRYGKLVKAKNSLVGIKQRDFATGEINSLDIFGKMPPAQFITKAIIVDDLCSYGGTFVRAANELRRNGIDKIYLVVTHCESSIYSGYIFKTDLIDGVFTTNSISRKLGIKLGELK
jgi:ribose-phosphate pyrophosphokinase